MNEPSAFSKLAGHFGPPSVRPTSDASAPPRRRLHHHRQRRRRRPPFRVWPAVNNIALPPSAPLPRLSLSFLSHYLLPEAAPEWLLATAEQKSIGNKLSTENFMLRTNGRAIIGSLVTDDFPLIAEGCVRTLQP